MIGIIDYGMGNLRSVEKAFQFLGFNAQVSENISFIEKADKIVLPGVGAFEDAITTIKNKGFDKIIKEQVNKGKPFLGICLGMHMLFDISYENGKFKGLGLIPGIVKKLNNNVKIPHIGWNNLKLYKKDPLFKDLSENPYVYFVHSYHIETDPSVVSATTFYGQEIQVAVQKDNIYATQFHPEKSGDIGLQILKNFSLL